MNVSLLPWKILSASTKNSHADTLSAVAVHETGLNILYDDTGVSILRVYVACIVCIYLHIPPRALARFCFTIASTMIAIHHVNTHFVVPSPPGVCVGNTARCRKPLIFGSGVVAYTRRMVRVYLYTTPVPYFLVPLVPYFLIPLWTKIDTTLVYKYQLIPPRMA